MRLSSLAAARPAYYDRNATSTSGSYGATVTQHASTTRYTVTVAAGTKLLIEAAETFILTVTAAATPLRLASRVSVTSGGNTQSLCATDITQSASVTAPTYSIQSLAVTAYVGDTVTGTTFMDSVTGSAYMATSFRGTTYSA